MKRLLLSVVVAASLTGCATSTCNTPGCYDPAEGFNRTMFNFNYNVLDPYLVRPVAVFWKNYVPTPVRTGIKNFTTNLSEPASMVNYLIQGEGKQAAIHFTRFFLNTVFGLGGFIDVASMADNQLKVAQEKGFGSVLGNYGVGYGPYLVLPFYGAATPRENGGNYVDTLYPVLSFLTFGMSLGKWIVEGVESRAQAIDYENMLKNSDDPYSFTRDAYYQRKNFLANDGKVKLAPTKNQQEISDVIDEIDSE